MIISQIFFGCSWSVEVSGEALCYCGIISLCRAWPIHSFTFAVIHSRLMHREMPTLPDSLLIWASRGNMSWLCEYEPTSTAWVISVQMSPDTAKYSPLPVGELSCDWTQRCPVQNQSANLCSQPLVCSPWTTCRLTLSLLCPAGLSLCFWKKSRYMIY